MTSKSSVRLSGNPKPVILTYEICNSEHYEVVKFTNNWSTLYDIRCDKLKTTIMQVSFLVGAVIGLACVKFLSYKYYKENLIKFFLGLYCVSLLLCIINKYESTVIMWFMPSSNIPNEKNNNN